MSFSIFDDDPNDVCPLITVQDEQYTVHEETLAWLCTLTQPLCIVSCAGKYRTGKSFLLNCLCDNEFGFAVGNTVQACTKGIWIYKKPLAKDDKKIVLVMDTEGIDALDAEDNHDVRIFTLALLLSSSFLYNSTGPIDESALQTLSLMTKISEFVKVSSDQETTSIEMLSDHMPQFYWILRDFSLQIKNRAGEPCTDAQYLEEALSDAGHNEERGKVRQTVRNAFPQRHLVTLQRPNGDTQKLRLSHSGPKFKANVLELKSKLLGEVRTLKANGRPISGKMFSEMCKHFVACINKPNTVPVIKDTWTLLADVQARDLSDQLLTEAENLIESTSKTFLDYDILQQELAKVKSTLLEKFSHNLLGDVPNLEENLDQKLGKLVDRELLLCEQRSVAKLEQEIDRVSVLVREEQSGDLEVLAKLIRDVDRMARTQHEKFQLVAYRAVVQKSCADWFPHFSSLAQKKLEDLASASAGNDKLREHIEVMNKAFQVEKEGLERTIDNVKMEMKNEGEAIAAEANMHVEHLKQENTQLMDQNEVQEKKLQELIVWQSMVAAEKERSPLQSSTDSSEISTSYSEDDYFNSTKSAVEEEECRQNVKKIQELEAQLRTNNDEINELRAIRSTLMNQNAANKEAREKLEVLCSEKLRQLQQRHSQGIQKQREAYEDTLKSLNGDVETLSTSKKKLSEDVKASQTKSETLENSMKENKSAYERELRIQKESQLTARATCEDLQERIVKMHSASLEDIRLRDAANRERQTKITGELLQSQIEKGEAMRQLDRCNAELATVKRKLVDKEDTESENRRLKQKLNECESNLVQMKTESGFLRNKTDELIREREDIRGSLMQSERQNALLEREVSIFKVENDLKE